MYPMELKASMAAHRLDWGRMAVNEEKAFMKLCPAIR
jgi:hypothetical protein